MVKGRPRIAKAGPVTLQPTSQPCKQNSKCSGLGGCAACSGLSCRLPPHAQIISKQFYSVDDKQRLTVRTLGVPFDAALFHDYTAVAEHQPGTPGVLVNVAVKSWNETHSNHVTMEITYELPNDVITIKGGGITPLTHGRNDFAFSLPSKRQVVSTRLYIRNSRGGGYLGGYTKLELGESFNGVSLHHWEERTTPDSFLVILPVTNPGKALVEAFAELDYIDP